MVYCARCGSENDGTSKFCGNCGAELQASATQEQVNQTEGALSSGETVPVYEKVTDAEVQKPEPILSQDGEKSNPYSGSETQNNNGGSNAYTNPYYDAQSPQYYSSNQNEINQEGGKIGFSIASLVCGILSLTCCCASILGGILAVAAVALGIIALRNKYDGKGMAIAGIITGGIGFMIAGISLILIGAGGFMDMFDELQKL